MPGRFRPPSRRAPQIPHCIFCVLSMTQTKYAEAILLPYEEDAQFQRVKIRLTPDNLYDIGFIFGIIGGPCASIGLEKLDQTHYLIYDDHGSSNGQPLNLYFRRIWQKEMCGRILILRWEGGTCRDMEHVDEGDLIEWADAIRQVATIRELEATRRRSRSLSPTRNPLTRNPNPTLTRNPNPTLTPNPNPDPNPNPNTNQSTNTGNTENTGGAG